MAQKTQSPELGGFAWQRGYGAFSIGSSDFDALRQYIGKQEEDHQPRTFQEEYQTFLTKCGVEYEEPRCGWDCMMERAFSPVFCWGHISWGVAPGWDSGAPLARKQSWCRGRSTYR